MLNKCFTCFTYSLCNELSVYSNDDMHIEHAGLDPQSTTFCFPTVEGKLILIIKHIILTFISYDLKLNFIIYSISFETINFSFDRLCVFTNQFATTVTKKLLLFPLFLTSKRKILTPLS